MAATASRELGNGRSELCFWLVDVGSTPTGSTNNFKERWQSQVDCAALLRRWRGGHPVRGFESHPFRHGVLERPSITPLGGLVAVAPVDEFDDEDQRYGEGDLTEAHLGVSVGAATDLTEVRQPRVGPLDNPAPTQRCVCPTRPLELRACPSGIFPIYHTGGY